MLNVDEQIRCFQTTQGITIFGKSMILHNSNSQSAILDKCNKYEAGLADLSTTCIDIPYECQLKSLLLYFQSCSLLLWLEKQ